MLEKGKDPAFDKAIDSAKDQILADLRQFLNMLEKDIRTGDFRKTEKYDGQGFPLVNTIFTGDKRRDGRLTPPLGGLFTMSKNR